MALFSAVHLAAFAGQALCEPETSDLPTHHAIPIPLQKPDMANAKDDKAAAPEPTFFKIATGSPTGTYFAVGEVLAGLISHPPGAERCIEIERCGPEGMLAVAQNSDGAMRNIIAVASGQIAAGLAPADLLNDAYAGSQIFSEVGPQKNLRAITHLYAESLHLISAAQSQITQLDDLKDKRVSLGRRGTGGYTYAHLLLDARGLRDSVTRLELDLYDAADQLLTGELDAFFHLGGTPVPFINDLLSTGSVKLNNITGERIAVLYDSRPFMRPNLIQADTYSQTGQIETIASNAYWIVADTVSEDRVYAITRAFWHPSNQAERASEPEPVTWSQISEAIEDLPVPLHPGAKRFYEEVGVLTSPEDTQELTPETTPALEAQDEDEDDVNLN